MVKNDSHFEKETAIGTEFGGAHDCGTLPGGLIEGKTLKGAQLHFATFHLTGNRDYFVLDLEEPVRIVHDPHAGNGFIDEVIQRHERENGARGLRDVEAG